jgi:3-ketosteroid 9alpha-monooxygenase subunit A
MAQTAEYALGAQTFARGWHMVADAATVSRNPRAVRFFGRDMVLYRGDSGQAYLVGAYCPHMGAHIARNATSYIVRDGEQVEGESIRCPFHGWRFGPDGRCNQIPYSEQRIPAAAMLPAWPIVERAGILWTWHDPEGGDPDVDLPSFAQWYDASWERWRIDDLGTLPQHPIEIFDNMTDMAHFIPIHGSEKIRYFVNRFDGQTAWQYFGAGHRTLVGSTGDVLRSEAWYTGPALLQSTMVGAFATHMLIAHTPVDDGVVQVWHALMVKADGIPPGDERDAAVRAYQQASLDAFAQDFEIWRYKRASITPMKVRGDGPVEKGRLWYRQFYAPRREASAIQARVDGIHATIGDEDIARPADAIANSPDLDRIEA